jgi:hypothetical protein
VTNNRERQRICVSGWKIDGITGPTDWNGPSRRYKILFIEQGNFQCWKVLADSTKEFLNLLVCRDELGSPVSKQ